MIFHSSYIFPIPLSVIDTNSYRIKQQKQQEALQRCSPPPKLKCPERNNNNTMGQTVNILGTEDAMCLQKGEPLPKYDACVWFADADIEYATEIITNLESPPYNRKVSLGSHLPKMTRSQTKSFLSTAFLTASRSARRRAIRACGVYRIHDHAMRLPDCGNDASVPQQPRAYFLG